MHEDDTVAPPAGGEGVVGQRSTFDSRDPNSDATLRLLAEADLDGEGAIQRRAGGGRGADRRLFPGDTNTGMLQ